MDIYVCGLSELYQIFVESIRIINPHSLVRPPSRKHFYAERMLGDISVPFKSICRVIRRADHLDIEFFDKILARIFRRLQFFIALVKNFFRSFRFQNFIYSKNPGKFQMSPYIKRISHQRRNSFCPFLEFIPRGTVAGDVILTHSVSPHSPPFIMVAAQPQFRDVLELIVLGYHPGSQMAVIVDN